MPDSRIPDRPPHESGPTEIPIVINSDEPFRGTKRRQLTPAEFRRKKIKRFAIGTIPFFIILISLSLISVGLLHYIEQESILSIFLTKRDAIPVTASTEQIATTPITELTEGEVKPVPTQADPAERLQVPFYYIGDQIGIIRIPSVDIEVAALQGDRENEFRIGAGHYTGSLLPGQGGNILIGAHRTSYFRNFEYLELGAEIEFATNYGRFTYEVDDMFLIDGKDHSIGEPTKEEQLTLYTCYPFGFIGNAPQRYVVVSKLVDSEIYYLDETAESEAE